MTDQKHTKELEDFEDAMKERWDQLKGYFDHPRLDKPLALPDDCDKCHVNLKLFFNDCKKHMAFQLTSVTKQQDELREALDKIIKASNGSGSFINAMIEGEKLLTKTKESV